MAWILTLAWAVHSFPDLHALYQLFPITSKCLLLLFCEKLMPEINNEAIAWPVTMTLVNLWGMHRDSSACSEFLMTFVPSSPHVTSGGDRFLHQVRPFLRRNYKLFQ